MSRHDLGSVDIHIWIGQHGLSHTIGMGWQQSGLHLLCPTLFVLDHCVQGASYAIEQDSCKIDSSDMISIGLLFPTYLTSSKDEEGLRQR